MTPIRTTPSSNQRSCHHVLRCRRSVNAGSAESGPRILTQEDHDHRHTDVEREVLVPDTVAEVVRREREEDGTDERRRPRASQRPQRGERGERGERERQEPEQVEGERNVARGLDDGLLDRVGEEVAAHRPLGPLLLERRVERGVRVEPARLVDVLDQHHVERGVLLIVARRLRVLERDVEVLAPQLHHDGHREARQERGEERAGDEGPAARSPRPWRGSPLGRERRRLAQGTHDAGSLRDRPEKSFAPAAGSVVAS